MRRRRAWRTRSTATTASREPISGQHPRPTWAPLAVAVDERQGEGRPLDRPDALDGRRGVARAAHRRTPGSPSSTSTTTATSTSCSPPTARPPVAILNDRLGQFHEAAMQGPRRPTIRLRPARRPTSTPTAAPTSSRRARTGRCSPGGIRRSGPPAKRPSSPSSRGRSMRAELAIGPGDRPGPRRPARPARTARRRRASPGCHPAVLGAQ